MSPDNRQPARPQAHRSSLDDVQTPSGAASSGRRGVRVPAACQNDAEPDIAQQPDGIKADVLLPGHGEAWTEGVEEAIRQARAAGPS
jgi:hypothetical protein